jgi:plastocyanin
VSVGEIDFAFNMSRTTIPCGNVAFHTSNTGEADHNFTVLGVGAPGVGPIIHPGANADFTVALNPGTYNTVCDVPTHAALGMTGSITITA